MRPLGIGSRSATELKPLLSHARHGKRRRICRRCSSSSTGSSGSRTRLLTHTEIRSHLHMPRYPALLIMQCHVKHRSSALLRMWYALRRQLLRRCQRHCCHAAGLLMRMLDRG